MKGALAGIVLALALIAGPGTRTAAAFPLCICFPCCCCCNCACVFCELVSCCVPRWIIDSPIRSSLADRHRTWSTYPEAYRKVQHAWGAWIGALGGENPRRTLARKIGEPPRTDEALPGEGSFEEATKAGNNRSIRTESLRQQLLSDATRFVRESAVAIGGLEEALAQTGDAGANARDVRENLRRAAEAERIRGALETLTTSVEEVIAMMLVMEQQRHAGRRQ